MNEGELCSRAQFGLGDLVDDFSVLRGITREAQQIHKRFELAVIAAGMRGISAADVERTFLLPPDYTRGIKPDVVLRDDIGDIIAIYDVKTLDAALWPKRVRLLRTATRVDPSVYVIDLHVERGATLKFRWNELGGRLT